MASSEWSWLILNIDHNNHKTHHTQETLQPFELHYNNIQDYATSCIISLEVVKQEPRDDIAGTKQDRVFPQVKNRMLHNGTFWITNSSGIFISMERVAQQRMNLHKDYSNYLQVLLLKPIQDKELKHS